MFTTQPNSFSKNAGMSVPPPTNDILNGVFEIINNDHPIVGESPEV